MNKVVGVQSAADYVGISPEYIAELRRKAADNISKITSKPTLEEMYKCVDALWEKGKPEQLMFQNKDQHYQYVTNLYKEQIEPITVEQYRKMVYSQTMSMLDSFASMCDIQKQQRAAELHREYEKKAVDTVEELGNELVEMNKKANEEEKEKIKEVNKALWGEKPNDTGSNNN